MTMRRPNIALHHQPSALLTKGSTKKVDMLTTTPPHHYDQGTVGASKSAVTGHLAKDLIF